MTQAIPQDPPLLPNGRFSTSWQRFFIGLNISSGGSVTTVSIVPANGISGTVTNPTTTPAISLALGNITPTLVTCTGAVTGTNLSGTNTGDQTITLTGDVTGSGTGSFAATVGKIGGKTISLAGDLTTSGAFASTFTMTGITTVTFPVAGTLATLAGAEALSNKTITASSFAGTTVAATTSVLSSGSGGVGYSTGAGGAVTQLTSKATGVTLSKTCGQITMNAASLGANTTVSFTLTNTLIAATDTIDIHRSSGGTAASYNVWVDSVAAGSCVICVRNISAGALLEAVVLNFSLCKAVNA
jgi:hypothetical protein